ncbi:MAG: hypothetical protein GF368_00355 [Candidatus Aenigmarchaeota archaeon]|nr:hypothetical protein [Candidatus Aenigmarchaeota archaeon]
MQLSVRNVDKKVFENFKVEVTKEGLTIGKALTMALDQWIESKKKRKENFLDLKPIDWGEGTENTSEEIDDILYGG